MHVLFIHQNFPAQFGHIAHYLAKEHRFRCTFVTNHPPRQAVGFDVIPYRTIGGATAHNSYFTRTFENAVAHAHGVYEACEAHRQLAPDLIVAHSGFGSSLFLRELFHAPILNYFEYYYHPHHSDMDFRPDFPPRPNDVLRSYCRNAMLLLDLENCAAGYSPTQWQRSRFPTTYQPKIATIFDGVDTSVWRRQDDALRVVMGRAIEPNTRIVTYVSRGFELMRGFDIFLRVAKRIYEQMPNVLFVVVGSDRVSYGGDERFTGGKSFREYALSRDQYDLSKFLFTGMMPPVRLAELWSIADLHIYLTVPFVLSWSLFNALACGITALASNTEPVRELIADGKTGLLADFFDVEGFASRALDVLADPPAYRKLGEAGRALIAERYALNRCLPQMLDLYQRVQSARAGA